ncbi:MAG: TetR/AcrR family transcriptional regulator [Desulfobacteraceae bacterium]|jgi:AcrR family transcriptional regulator
MSRKIMKDQRRLEILEALHRRLLIKPFDKTSIKEIAAEAGMNHGMLHYYFKSKEDILLNYIEHVIETYKNMFRTWMGSTEVKTETPSGLLAMSLDFMARKITMNRDLSRIFIEIWEIANYNDKVRQKLKTSYMTWIGMAGGFIADKTISEKKALMMGTALVAFSEGLSMLSVVLDQDETELEELLGVFRAIVLSFVEKV